MDFLPTITDHKQRLLASEMSRLSEECYCAGWMDGLEYALWDIVQGAKPHYGMSVITPQDIQTLRWLSDTIGGWIVFDANTYETFMPMAAWLAAFAAWKAATT